MDDEHYGHDSVAFLGQLWGEGYMSPGGADEVALVLAGVDLAGKRVLDIGSGAGGITVSLVRDHGAAEVVGIDVEETVCTVATARVEATALSDRVSIERVEPGPLPFADATFDVVFSKDSIVHIADKEALALDVHRVLRPGGWFAASDWMTSHDGPPSAAMAEYLRREDLDFGMASPDRYRRALVSAGFVDVELTNRNPWYLDLARDELDRLRGPERERFEELVPADDVARQIATWQAMLPVLESGEHCPHHLRGRVRA